MSKGKESRDVRVLIKDIRNVLEAASVDRNQDEKEMNVWGQRHRHLIEAMQEEGASSTENSVMIYCLPEFMMRSVECKRWFVPAVTSVGPLHFRCSDGVGVVSMGAVARIKEEAISFIMTVYGVADRQRIMESLLSDIGGREQKIKACYSDGRRIPVFLRDDRFAWMMVVDACYLLVALSVLSQKTTVDSKRWPALALLQGEGYRRQEVVHDLLKIENQIPLWVVKLVARHLPGWVPIENGELSQLVDMQKVLQRLCPFSIFDFSDRVLTLFEARGLRFPETSRWRRCYNDHRGTLLYILLLFSLGENEKTYAKTLPREETKFEWEVFVELVRPILDLLALLWNIFKKMELGLLMEQSVLPVQNSTPVSLVQRSFVVLAMVVAAMGTVLLALVALPFMVVGAAVGTVLVALVALLFIVVAFLWQPASSAYTVNLEAHAVLESGVKLNVSTTAVGILSAVYWREEGGQLGLPRTRLDELGMVALWNMVALEQMNPATLEQMNPAIEQLNLAFKQLNPAAVEQLNPAVEQLNLALKQLNPAVEQLNLALKQLNLAVQQLNPAAVEQLNPALEQLNLALEQLNPEHARRRTPLCNYVCLMSDLLGSADDVLRLEDEQIIETVASSSRDDVVQLWQDLKLLATTSGAGTDDKSILTGQDTNKRGDQSESSLSDPEPIRRAHTSLSTFVKSRQRLWYALRRPKSWLSFLSSQYGSSQWLALSTVGAIALLLMTGAQVFCLFYKCPGTQG